MLAPAAFEPIGEALAPAQPRKRDRDGDAEAEIGMLLPWEMPLPSRWEDLETEQRQRDTARDRTSIEVPCPGARPGEERSVRLPDGRECLVRVPSNVTNGRFSVQWTPILPPSKKRRRHAGDSRASAKDAKTWKAVDALIAARPSSALATSELRRLRGPGARIFADACEYDGAFEFAATTSTGLFGIPDFLMC